MSSSSRATLAALVVLAIAVASASAAETAERPKRLPNQQYNRMLYVRTDDKADVYRDNPWSPCLSWDGKSAVVVVDSKGPKKPAAESDE